MGFVISDDFGRTLDRYNLMKDIRKKMTAELQQLRMQKFQNDICLINAKRQLYSQNVFGIMDMDAMCTKASKYIGMVSRKEIRKNAKCEERNSYDMLKASIGSATGIEIKSIEKIVFYNYSMSFKIHFIDAKYGMKLEIIIPNIRNKAFYPSISCDIGEEYIDESIRNLNTELMHIKHETEFSMDLENIASYPECCWVKGTVCDISEFYDALDKFAESMEQEG